MSEDQGELYFHGPSETADQANSPKQITPIHDGGNANDLQKPHSNRTTPRPKERFAVIRQDRPSQPYSLFLSDQEVAVRYSVSRPTIWRWVKTQFDFPAPVKVTEGTTRWRLDDLEKFELARGQESAQTNSSGSSEGVGK